MSDIMLKFIAACSNTTEGETVVTDATPAAVNWNNIDTANASINTNTQTITGINTTITLSWTGTEDDDGGTVSAIVNGSSAGSTSTPGSFTFTVQNNDTLYFRHVTSGGSVNVGSATVRNVSDSNTVLDTYSYAVND